MGWIEQGRNWARKRQLKKEWLLAIRYIQGPGHGIEVPAHDVVAAAALQELLKEHPELTVQRFRENLTLTRRLDFEATSTKETAEFLHRGGFLARPGDDLVAAAELEEVQKQAKKEG